MDESIKNLESLPPEVVFQILLNLNDVDIVNICRVSSYLSSFCSDRDFWRKKANLDFEFPEGLFNQTDIKDPLLRYREIQMMYRHPDLNIHRAAHKGQAELVRYFINLGVSTMALNDALIEAADKGYMNIVREVLNNGATNLDDALYAAARTNDLALLTELLHAEDWPEEGIEEFNNALIIAARHGYLDAIREIINAGATNLGEALVNAATSNHLNVVQFLINTGAIDPMDIDWALRQAAYHGRLEIVRELVEHGATDLEDALQTAQERRHPEVVKYLRSIMPQ